jgi:hypothetical protein
VDPRADLDDWEKRKFIPYRDSTTEPSVVQSVASSYTDYAITGQVGVVYRHILFYRTHFYSAFHILKE